MVPAHSRCSLQSHLILQLLIQKVMSLGVQCRTRAHSVLHVCAHHIH